MIDFYEPLKSAFDYSWSCLLVLHKLKHFWGGKQDIKRKNSVIKFVSSVISLFYEIPFVLNKENVTCKIISYCFK